jgi:hypothetical protein
MKTFSLGKGRKKAVEKFTTRNGLWIMLIVAGGMIIMLALWLLGFFRVDASRKLASMVGNSGHRTGICGRACGALRSGVSSRKRR